MAKINLFISQDGNTIETVYNDIMGGRAQDAYDKLGKKEITRASNVEFNHENNEWEATDNSGTVIASGKNREAVIKEEVRVITERLRSK